MDVELRRDPLTVFGVGGGALLVGVAVATLLGAPWQYGSGTLATVLQILGTVGTAAVGLGLLALSTATAGRTSG